MTIITEETIFGETPAVRLANERTDEYEALPDDDAKRAWLVALYNEAYPRGTEDLLRALVAAS